MRNLMALKYICCLCLIFFYDASSSPRMTQLCVSACTCMYMYMCGATMVPLLIHELLLISHRLDFHLSALFRYQNSMYINDFMLHADYTCCWFAWKTVSNFLTFYLHCGYTHINCTCGWCKIQLIRCVNGIIRLLLLLYISGAFMAMEKGSTAERVIQSV